MDARAQALEELVATRGEALKRFAFLLCGDDAQADDLVQDAVVRTLVRRGVVSSLESYVRQAMVNGYLDRRRAGRTWLRYAPRLLGRREGDDVAGEVVARIGMEAALADLPPRQRACVVLRFYEDLPTAEIASLLGCGDSTVRAYLAEAMGRMRSQLRAEANQESGGGTRGE